jgi:hypothetical protein
MPCPSRAALALPCPACCASYRDARYVSRTPKSTPQIPIVPRRLREVSPERSVGADFQALCRDPFRKNFSTLQKRLYSALSIESMVPDIECSRVSAMYRTSNITNHHQCHEARVPGIACSDLADLTMRDIVTVIYLTGSMGFSLSEALQRTELYYAVPCGGITICDSILKKWRDEAEDANKLIYRRLDDLVYEARTSFFGEEWIVFSATPVRGAS